MCFEHRHKGDYGYDNPSGIFVLGAAGIILFVLAITQFLLLHRLHAFIELCFGLIFLLVDLGYLYSTRRGKFSCWAELIDDLHMNGDEQVLDMGCGRGAVISIVAKHLDTGHAYGIDLWSQVDQSGNKPETTLKNLELEGVKDKCSIETGNMMKMPYEDSKFDLIVSSLAIHNITNRNGRFKALDEALRVLKPGGRLIIVDLLPMAGNYRKHLYEKGMINVKEKAMDWRAWFGLPFVVRLITASKSNYS